MKKQYIFLILLLFGSSILFAQVEKGKCYFAASSNLGIDIGKDKWKSSGGGPVSEYKYSQFFLHPEAGYFVIDKLVVGVFISYDYYKEKEQDNNYTWKNTSFTIGPFVKYYILEYKKLYPYVGAGIGFGSEKDTESWEGGSSEYKYGLLTYRFGGGATYFLNDNVGLDLFLGYNHDVSKDKNTDEGKSMNSTDSKELDGSFKVGIGVVATFGK
jgi:outer membrane protein